MRSFVHPVVEMVETIVTERAVKQNLNAKTVAFVAAAVQKASEDEGYRFDRRMFLSQATSGLDELEYKARCEHLGRALYQSAGGSVSERMQLLVTAMGPIDVIPNLESSGAVWGPSLHFYAAFGSAIEQAAHAISPGYKPKNVHLQQRKRARDHLDDEFDAIMAACCALTRRSTSEFAVRPLILLDEARVLRTFHSWARHECPHVRRLTSEGSRPRLPWSLHIPSFKADPTRTVSLLEALKHDDYLYVRRSVANHVADILKDNEAFGLALCDRWATAAAAIQDHTKRKNAAWVVRHALRLLLKKDHTGANKIVKKLK